MRVAPLDLVLGVFLIFIGFLIFVSVYPASSMIAVGYGTVMNVLGWMVAFRVVVEPEFR